MFKMGQRQSILLDKKGCYFVILQYWNELIKAGQTLPDLELPPGGNRCFTYDDVCKWMQKLFRIGKHGYFAEHPTLHGKKFDNWSGVQLTTDGIKASLHYQKVVPPMMAPHDVSKNDDNVQNVRVFYIGPNGEFADSCGLGLQLVMFSYTNCVT